MELASSAFADGSVIPRRFTCDGDNLSPAFAMVRRASRNAEFRRAL